MASRDRKLYPQRACASYCGEILEELQVGYLVLLLGNTLLVSKTGFGKIGKFGRNLILVTIQLILLCRLGEEQAEEMNKYHFTGTNACLVSQET